MDTFSTSRELTADKMQDNMQDIIKDALEWFHKRRYRWQKYENYYQGNHDILKRTKTESLKNNKLVVNHCKYITEKFTGYLLGNPVEYRTVGSVEPSKIDALVEEYKKVSVSDVDLAIGQDCSVFGRGFGLVYANEEGSIRTARLSPLSAVLVYDDKIEPMPLMGIMVSAQTKEQLTGMVCTDTHFYNFTAKLRAVGDKMGVSVDMASEKEHFFGDVPLVEFANASDFASDYRDIISLVDAYNLLQSDRVNDKEQMVDSILALFGANIGEDERESVARVRFLEIPNTNARLEFINKAMSEEDVDVLRKSIEDNIHKISCVPNLNDEKFAGNTSGVAIRYKLLDFEMATKRKEVHFEKALMYRTKLYINHLVKRGAMGEIPLHDIDAVFKRSLPQNELEVAQMVNMLDGMIDKETLISQIPFVEDASKALEKLESERPDLPEFGTNTIRETEGYADEKFAEREMSVVEGRRR